MRTCLAAVLLVLVPSARAEVMEVDAPVAFELTLGKKAAKEARFGLGKQAQEHLEAFAHEALDGPFKKGVSPGADIALHLEIDEARQSFVDRGRLASADSEVMVAAEPTWRWTRGGSTVAEGKLDLEGRAPATGVRAAERIDGSPYKAQSTRPEPTFAVGGTAARREDYRAAWEDLLGKAVSDAFEAAWKAGVFQDAAATAPKGDS